MRLSLALPAAVLGLLAAAPAALAAFPHTVVPGESLSSVAAANGMSVATIAAATGISPETRIEAGSVVQIPPAGVGPAAAPATASAPASTGSGYTIAPGDTLSGVAARNGLSLSSLAAANGLSTTSILIAGEHLTISGSAPAAAAPAAPAATTTASAPAAAPSGSSGSVTSSDIAAVASRNGVPTDLASAIGWQESGFNNGAVSNVGARGVMQVMPSTFDWVQHNLARRTLNSSVPEDNVGAGVLYLGHLLQQTGGDADTAIAGYYQGLDSVRRIGMYDDTRRYVASVNALRGRYGG